MDRLWTIMKKEFLHIWRDPRTLTLIILLPAALLILLGYGVSGETSNVPLAVADLSKTDTSRRYIDYYTSSGYFKLMYDALSEDEIVGLIDRGLVQAGIYIPEDFSRQLETDKTTSVQFYVNGADPEMSQKTNLTLSAISQVAIQDILSQRFSRSGSAQGLQLPINAYTKILYNPDNRTLLYWIPGLIPIILQIQALLLTALAIVREREQGTMEQLIVTPIRSWELMLGKILPYLFIGIINMVATLFVAVYLFGVTIAGNLWMLIGLGALFILGSMGMGVLISNISETQMQAMYIAVGVVVLPAIILSGLMFSRTNMPLASYLVGEILPVTHFLEISRGIMMKGISANYLMESIIWLVVLSVVYFVGSVFTFRKHL
jgi:ABC-2 type transport system permease protein